MFPPASGRRAGHIHYRMTLLQVPIVNHAFGWGMGRPRALLFPTELDGRAHA